ncbi:MAG: terminase large subunit [Rhizobiales bacterium]|nr:terminase large subunit [Hyphomicrobiales bacterium]
MTAATTEAPKAERRRPPRRQAALDRATAYAHDVLAGRIIAGPHVRASCGRHLADLETAADRGLRFSVQLAADAIAFFEEVLCLNGGDYEGKPFILQPWQAFIVGSLYGWQRYEEKLADWVRRYRVAYVETGKGSGKSPLAAGVGMKGLTADGESRAEVYAAATKKDQAMVLFRDAVAMFQQSPELRARLTPSGVGENVWNLGYRSTGSWFRPISADDGQSGPRPHIALIDEVHEHKTAQVVEMMRAGTKSRRQALIFMITNSGAGKTTPCGIYHDYACDVAAARRVDDAFFSYVCGLDEGEDPLHDEACWPKANPSLQLANLPGLQYLREQVTEARGMPAKEAIVRRLNFCQWTAAINPWLSAAVWEPCQQDYAEDELRGRRAYAGLDLSSTTDLTAFVLLVEPAAEGDPWSVLPYCWLPEEGMQDRCNRDRVDYATWAKQGYLETTPGRAISKRHVLQRVAQICSRFDVQSIAADRWRMADFKQIAEDEGINLPPMLDFGQGFKDMSPALDAFETAVMNRTLRHNGHPVLTMCAANAVTDSDPAGNRKLNKIKATGRIDIVVAAVMAYASAASDIAPANLDEFLNSPLIG